MNLTHSELDFDLGPVTLTCTVDEVAAAFAGALREMRAAAPHIHAGERAALRQIMAHGHDAPTVAAVFPDFARNSDAHTTLRKLRTAQFIRPAGRDCWDRDEHIEVKPFARVAWDRLGEAALFGEEPAPQPDEDEDDIDLALPDVNDAAFQPHEAHETSGEQETVTKWNEDDVLDFLSDDDTKG